MCCNNSKVIYNTIQNQHQNGIKISSFGANICAPVVWLNLLEKCGYNGIEIRGKECCPDIRGNFIQHNRKAGIKLTEFAAAHIRGIKKPEYLDMGDSHGDRAMVKNLKAKLSALEANKDSGKAQGQALGLGQETEHQYAGAPDTR